MAKRPQMPPTEDTVNARALLHAIGPGARRIAGERLRQIGDEGYEAAHDDEHVGEELATAAACYALPATMRRLAGGAPTLWPFEAESWKPSPDDRIRELVKAGALIAAEIDRLIRAQHEYPLTDEPGQQREGFRG